MKRSQEKAIFHKLSKFALNGLTHSTSLEVSNKENSKKL